MKRFHHFGVPTTTPREGETYLPGARLYVTDPGSSPNAIEWLRFEPDCPMPATLRTRAHIAFEVDNLDAALVGQTILIEPFEPMDGVRVAFIMEDEQAVELMQITA